MSAFLSKEEQAWIDWVFDELRAHLEGIPVDSWILKMLF
jgi:hypothetical protein